MAIHGGQVGLRHRWSFESVADRLSRSEKSEIRLSTSGKRNVALIFLAPYGVGMSNLGFQTVHRILGTHPGIGVERFFLPLSERAPHPPPYYSFESRRPLGDFDILAFSLSFEGDFDTLPRLLGPMGIPVLRGQRRSPMPLLLAGGAAIGSNPAAMSEVFDILVPGEAETCLPPLLDSLLAVGACLESCADLPGIWVPAFRKRVNPAPAPHDVARFPAYSHISTPENIFCGSRLIEVMRGCPRKCAFCLATRLYHPARPVPLEAIAEWLARRPGVNDLGLVAPSLFDYPFLPDLFRLLREKHIRIRNSSVKWEKLNGEILQILRECGPRSLTLAPETGSPRLLKVMGKPLLHQNFYATIREVFAHDFEHIKMYFITGLPGEVDEDLLSTIDLIRTVVDIAGGQSAPSRGGGARSVTIAFSGFVPKLGTPWEGEQVLTAPEFRQRFGWLKQKLKKLPGAVKVTFESPSRIARQAYLAKAGPELGEELEKEAKKWQENTMTTTANDTVWEF